MKKGLVLSVAGLFVASLFGQTALAIPAFDKEWKEKYAGEGAKIAEVAAEAKCNVCHFGKSKKDKNDYGKAIAELLDKDNFKKDRLDAEPEAAKAEIIEAFEKVAEMESPAGGTYGSRIEAGDLPGTVEE